MIAKLIGARNEIEDVLRASSRDGTILSSAERDRLSSILSLIESLLQDLEEGSPNTSASAARHFRPRRRISSSDMSIFICSNKSALAQPSTRAPRYSSWALSRYDLCAM
jgi:hypothetical protein